VKFLAVIALLTCVFTGCNRASESKEAIRESIINSVSSKVNVGSMDVDVTSISFKGNEADATVSFRPKGAGPSSGLQMQYTLEQKSGKWVVKDKAQAGGSPHGAPQGSGPSGAEQPNPHGGAGAGGELPPGHPPLESGEAKK
jgi:hypothetical protein